MPTRRVTRGTCLVLFVCLALVGPHQLGVAAAADDSPLVEAVKRQDMKTVSTLLRDGAAVDERQSDGATALHWGVYRDNLDIVDMLLGAGADVNAVNRLGTPPLWLAAMNGSAPLIGRLLEAGADPNIALPEGETSLMTAARSGAGTFARTCSRRASSISSNR